MQNTSVILNAYGAATSAARAAHDPEHEWPHIEFHDHVVALHVHARANAFPEPAALYGWMDEQSKSLPYASFEAAPESVRTWFEVFRAEALALDPQWEPDSVEDDEV